MANKQTAAAHKGPIQPGPAGLLPPAAGLLATRFPDEGEGWVEGEIVPDDIVIQAIAENLLTRRNPTFFPGPLLVWGWNESTRIRAKAALDMVAQIPGINIITMPDYRPIYPKIYPETVMSPCHPNLTIWHNKIEVGLFMDAHCHFVNVLMKMIRAGTNCYTIALCANDTHEDAIASLGRVDLAMIARLRDAIITLRDSGKIVPWALTEAGKKELAEKAKTRKRMPAPDEVHVPTVKPGFGHDLHQGIDENEE